MLMSRSLANFCLMEERHDSGRHRHVGGDGQNQLEH